MNFFLVKNINRWPNKGGTGHILGSTNLINMEKYILNFLKQSKYLKI